MEMALRIIKIPLPRFGSKSILTLLVILIATIIAPLLLLTGFVGVKYANAERRVIEGSMVERQRRGGGDFAWFGRSSEKIDLVERPRSDCFRMGE